MPTTIQIKEKTLESLKKSKQHPRQTYDELLNNMIKTFTRINKNNEYDFFLHKVQQHKMKELWDNKEDEAWENA